VASLKAAVLVIDMLNDFIRGRLRLDRADKIIPAIRRLIGFARREGIPVIYVCDCHAPRADRELELWGEHCIRGSEGARVIEELEPESNDIIVEKRRYSGFYQTDLDLTLREMDVDTLVLTGVAANICIQHTAADAFYRGYKTLVPADGVEAFTDEEQAQALEYMKRMYGTEITTVEELIKRLGRQVL